jgi:hypothetical protein
MFRKILASVALLLGLIEANDRHFYHLEQHLSVPDFTEYNFTQKVDHDDPQSAEFQQRYFDNVAFWDEKEGPIFLFICGEGTCNPPTTRGFPVQVAKEFKARFFVVEHRYYGSSQPFGDWSTPNLKYLNAD